MGAGGEWHCDGGTEGTLLTVGGGGGGGGEINTNLSPRPSPSFLSRGQKAGCRSEMCLSIVREAQCATDNWYCLSPIYGSYKYWYSIPIQGVYCVYTLYYSIAIQCTIN